MRTALVMMSALFLLSERVKADDATIAEIDSLVGKSFNAKDSLAPDDEPSADARECLKGLCWQAAEFRVECEKPAGKDRGDVLVRFPSPIESGDTRNDRVALEWYVARDDEQQPKQAKAVVVVHESGSAMTAGRLFAQGLRQRGLHAFLLHLPYYGERRTGKERPRDANLFVALRQAIADVRRARDAVTVLPLVDVSHIALQGTSLGGFVSATAAGLDDGYDSVFLMLAGGELFDLIQNGKRDTAKVRERLEQAGVTDDELQALTQLIEPTRIAHRLDPERTWLYSGEFDMVVPMKNAQALAEAAKLAKTHHIRMRANHYTGIVYLPFVLGHIETQIGAVGEGNRATGR